MIKVLFFCHGNICRSPMAEYIFRKLVSVVGTFDKFEIASAATSSEEIWNGRGNPVYPAAKQKNYASMVSTVMVNMLVKLQLVIMYTMIY